MEKKLNEFKISTLRSFGSQNISFTATVYSENQVLSEAEIEAQIKSIDFLVSKAFQASCEQEISEKEILVKHSERKAAVVAKHNAALNEEMRIAKEGQETLKNAEKLNKKLTK